MRWERIAALRQRLGLTGNELGSLIGVNGSTVYRWCTGDDRGKPTPLATVILLALENVASRRPDAGSWVMGLVTTRGLGYALHALLWESQGAMARGLQASTDMRTTQLDPKKTIAAVIAAKGNKTHAAKALNVDRKTLWSFFSGRPDLWDQLDAELKRRGLPVWPRLSPRAAESPARKAPRKPGR